MFPGSDAPRERPRVGSNKTLPVSMTPYLGEVVPDANAPSRTRPEWDPSEDFLESFRWPPLLWRL